MPQTHVFIRGTEYEEKFKSRAESEMLLSDLVALRRRLWDTRAKICQLERVFGETKDLKAEVALLQAQIDSAAERFGLQPITVEEY